MSVTLDLYHAARRTICCLRPAARPVRIELSRAVQQNLRLGPLTYGEWDKRFASLLKMVNTPVFSAYQLTEPDDLLTFDRGMITAGETLGRPKLGRHYHPVLDFWAAFNETVRLELNPAEDKKGRDRLTEHSLLFLCIRQVEAKLRKGLPVTPAEVREINETSARAGSPYQFTIQHNKWLPRDYQALASGVC